MVVTSDFGSESPGSSPGSPTKRDNLMKAIKDKKKFGGTSLVPKNHNCRKFGYSYDKEVRRLWRMEAKRIAHKVLMHLPISREEIQKAWSNPYMNLSELGVPSVMFGGGSSSNSAMDAVGLKMLLDITKSLDKTSK